jgi:hypothetical protein
MKMKDKTRRKTTRTLGDKLKRSEFRNSSREIEKISEIEQGSR